MALKDYQAYNNARSAVVGTLSASWLSLICTTGEGALFPSVYPYLLFLERYVNWEVTKREVVNVTNRAADVFTITRSAGYCVGDDTASPKTRVNTAFSFVDWDYISLYVGAGILDDLNDELVRLEANKANIEDIQNGTYVYQSSSTGTDAYAITTTPAISAYAVWQCFKFMADVANTGAATLNICSKGAITIKKGHDIDLADWDIEANQIVTVSYDWTNFQMDSQVATIANIDVHWQTEKEYMLDDDEIIIADSENSFANRRVTYKNSKSYWLANRDFITAEALTAWMCIFLEPPTTFALATTEQEIGDAAANTRYAFRVYWNGVSMTTMKMSLMKVTAPSVNLWIRIETDNAGEPSGTLADANAYATIAVGDLGAALADEVVTFAGAFTPAKWTVYRVVLFAGTYWAETVNAVNYYKIGQYTNLTNTRINLLENAWRSAGGNTLYTTYYDADWLYDYVYAKADATYDYTLPQTQRIINDTFAIGSIPTYDNRWFTKTLTVAQGESMYLTDTPWVLGTTPWTELVHIGYCEYVNELLLDTEVYLHSRIEDVASRGAAGTTYGTTIQILREQIVSIRMWAAGTIGTGWTHATASFEVSYDWSTRTTVASQTQWESTSEAVKNVSYNMPRWMYIRGNATVNSTGNASVRVMYQG